MSRSPNHRRNRALTWLAWTACALLAAALLVFVYLAHEGLGLFSGLWWKTDRDTWRVVEPGARLMVGVHPTSETRGLGLTLFNSGTKALTLPFVNATGDDPWRPFDEQVQAVIASAARPADRAALLAEWTQRRVRATTVTPKAQHWDAHPWSVMYGTGYGDCDDLSYVLHVAALAADLPSRVLALEGHAAVEVWFGEAWHLYDPTYCYVFHRGDSPLGLDDIRRHRDRRVQTPAHHPQLFTRLLDTVWQNEAAVADVEIPANWRRPPSPLVLAPGESWRLQLTTYRRLFAGREGSEDVSIARGLLDLSLAPGDLDLDLPFPILRAWVETRSDAARAGTVACSPERRPPRPADSPWRTVGPWQTQQLGDWRHEPKPVYRLQVWAPKPWAESARLVVETACAASWVPAPRPGLTALVAGWSEGDGMTVTLEWQRR
jgi:hypothetical protein